MRRRDFITIFGAAGILIGQSPVIAQTFRTYNHNASEAYSFVRITLRERRHQFEDYKDGHHPQARKAIDRMCHSVMVIEQWSISASANGVSNVALGGKADMPFCTTQKRTLKPTCPRTAVICLKLYCTV